MLEHSLHALGDSSPGRFFAQSSRPAPARRILCDITQTRHVFCLLQAELTDRLWQKAVLDIPTDADVADLQKQMALMHDRLTRLRDDLKKTDLRAWRIHQYGLGVVLDEDKDHEDKDHGERKQTRPQGGPSCERSH